MIFFNWINTVFAYLNIFVVLYIQVTWHEWKLIRHGLYSECVFKKAPVWQHNQLWLLLCHSVLSNSFATPWTLVYQDPLYMGFSRQEYWSGLPFPSPVIESTRELKNGRPDLRKFYIQKGSMVSTCLICISSYYSAYEDIKNIINSFFPPLNKMSVSFSTKESESESCSVVSYSLWPHGLVQRILQAKILEWVAFPFSRESSQPRDWTEVFHIACGSFTSWATRETLSTKLIALKKTVLGVALGVENQLPIWPYSTYEKKVVTSIQTYSISQIRNTRSLDFPCGPKAKSLHSPFRNPGFDLWSGN